MKSRQMKAEQAGLATDTQCNSKSTGLPAEGSKETLLSAISPLDNQDPARHAIGVPIAQHGKPTTFEGL